MKKCAAIMTILTMLVIMICGCSSNSVKTSEKSKETITIAYQPCIGHVPFIVMKEQKLLERTYPGEIEVNWLEMKSGAAINEGVVSGEIDAGAVGLAVAIAGIEAKGPYKIGFGLSAHPFLIMSRDDNIQSLTDIGKDTQIAIVNINSQPHILLAKAAKAMLGDAHALDSNLTVLSNADGYSALISGAVDCHMVSSPYCFIEKDNHETLVHEIEIGSDIWPEENTAQVAIVSNKLHDEKPEVYNALVSAAQEAMNYIDEHPMETAKMLSTTYDADVADIQEWVTDDRTKFDIKLHGVMDMVRFMVDEGFLEDGPSSFSGMAYEEVEGD